MSLLNLIEELGPSIKDVIINSFIFKFKLAFNFKFYYFISFDFRCLKAIFLKTVSNEFPKMESLFLNKLRHWYSCLQQVSASLLRRLLFLYLNFNSYYFHAVIVFLRWINVFLVEIFYKVFARVWIEIPTFIYFIDNTAICHSLKAYLLSYFSLFRHKLWRLSLIGLLYSRICSNEYLSSLFWTC